MYSLSRQRANHFLVGRALHTACNTHSIWLRPAILLSTRHSIMSFRRSIHSSKPSEPVPSATRSVTYSKNQPEDLPDRVWRLSRWTVSPSGKGLVRQFTFPTFAAAWRFMSVVAEECKAKRHHPSWHNLYNQVTVEWTTHKPEGLSVKDVEMAEFCDRKAIEIGLKPEELNLSRTEASTGSPTATNNPCPSG